MQKRELDAPSVIEYVPPGQPMQYLVNSLENIAYESNPVPSAVKYVPAEQFLQSICDLDPFTVEYVPALHFWHDKLFRAPS